MIGWALGGIEREIAETRNRLAALTARANQLRKQAGKRVQAALPSAAGSGGEEPAAASGRRRRRRMSAEGRKRLSEKLRKRWAERKRKGHTRL